MNTPRMGLPARLADTLSMPEQHEYLRRAFSRRGLLRGGAVAAGTALAGGTADLAGAATPRGLPGDSSNYDARQWDSFLAQIEPLATRVPWMVAFGNHDMESWYSPNRYSFIRVDVAPARPGRTTTLTVRALAATGAEVDRFTVSRSVAG